ncbi:F-box protein [Cardamine amara subsp. amara]|uniref:F-box protein n=1 Tax=Cardamine amara subsp. amara TaxID=228776 RepID=A0ABD1C089_CARAN
MALGRRILGAAKTSSKSNQNVVCDGGLGLGLEFAKSKRGFGRKRVLVSDGQIRDSSKVREETLSKSRKLEALPQDILVRIICGVEHEDLKQLFNVSKTIREATLIAKKWHFEYTTPRKTLFFQNGLDSMIDLRGGIEAPLLKKHRLSRISCDKKVSKISMALFK